MFRFSVFISVLFSALFPAAISFARDTAASQLFRSNEFLADYFTEHQPQKEQTDLYCGQLTPKTTAEITEELPCQSDSIVMQQHSWRFFPDGFIYSNYLAGVNESRLASVFNHDKYVNDIWDITLGGKFGLLRYGNKNPYFPEGFQIDFEGSSHLRLDFEHERDLDAADFRAGMPLTFGNTIWQFKTGYYHVSSHLGDERILRLQAAGLPHNRLNYVREAWVLGASYRFHPSFRLYAEADYAFWTGEKTKPWHFQFGAEYSPVYPANYGYGTPFAAVNLLLLQEHNYDGSICFQAGWQWKGHRNQVFRIGFQYFGGVSEQYEYITAKREHKAGFGIWYDF